MTNKNRTQEKQDALIRMVAGAGLMLVGVALALLLFGGRGSTAPEAQASEYSVVPAAVNFRAPELSLTNINGKAESLEDYRQNVVLVNNWATWCPPCKAEMPTLESYYESHAGEGFMVIAIGAGEVQKDVVPFAESYGLKFQVWVDPQTAAMAAFRNSNLPSSYVIDRSGTVRYAWTGQISRAMLEKVVTPLLKSD